MENSSGRNELQNAEMSYKKIKGNFDFLSTLLEKDNNFLRVPLLLSFHMQ